MNLRTALPAILALSVLTAACDLLESTPTPAPIPNPPSTATTQSMATATSEPTSAETPLSSPTPTLTPTPPITLETQLPRNVWEQFHSSFYAGCLEPPFDSLKVAKSWAGSGDSEIEFTPPGGTYFLVVVTSPSESDWKFDSVLEASGRRRFQSLHVDSTIVDDIADAQEWCHTGSGRILPDTLEIEATGLTWIVYLVSPSGSEPIPRPAASALTGYYSGCPLLPALEDLQVIETWTSEQGISERSLEFTGSPSFFFLGLEFEPNTDDWYFQSVNVRGDWAVAGPSVSSNTSGKIDFTATCPTTSSPYHLEVEADGGNWTIYLIGTK